MLAHMSVRTWGGWISAPPVSEAIRRLPQAFGRLRRRPAGSLLALALVLLGPSLLAVEITRVDPSLVSTQGGTEVTFLGSGFVRGMVARIGSQPLDRQVVVDGEHIRGATPALTAGFHAADVLGATGGVVASLGRIVEAAPPPVLIAVEPREVLADGSTEVTIRGANLRDATSITIGSRPLVNARLAGRNGTAIIGFAPALSPAERLGPRDVTASDSRGSATLPAGVTYVAPTVPPRGYHRGGPTDRLDAWRHHGDFPGPRV